MAWNPEIYNQFKDIRYKPFYDLASLLKEDTKGTAIDIGCGTGEQTAILANRFPNLSFIGVDSSPEMLQKSSGYVGDRVLFKEATIEETAHSQQQWDLIFSNAALQWADKHEELFPALLDRIKPGGQFAVQMPLQNENMLNILLRELADEAPYKSWLSGWNRQSSVLTLDAYAQMLFDGNMVDIQLSQKVYPIIANSHQELFNFISGSALIPYLERLTEQQKPLFTAAFMQKIKEAYPQLPAFYAFKRILIYAQKNV
ncbi:methyltransferase domain-containing protein [Sphingobacterium psychroaquaticum]|uniref:Trans-aconitate 2-methyltransferase n=1 Tax=Sphingobacterium psychroaquaticum TaxID=561061 RepID=A0A1X7JT99_9SPHI|nr:methyltransferase domain-containing protein [Sphingobacterium psychroaquaticum]QBQ41148.1 methyltransferase domain-containing protein [Sphingobacterium psychroaquaticum]SMG31401.1 trans-aconitate 2-methyltransferase [Sphingobacterium psychroaquaticum]